MACDALPNRREGVSRELFEHVVQAMNRLLCERPRHRRIMVSRSFHASDIEEERGAGRHGLHEYRRGPPDERRNPQQSTGPYVSNGDLAAVAGIHIHAKQPLENDGQSFSVRFGVHNLRGREFDDAPILDQ